MLHALQNKIKDSVIYTDSLIVVRKLSSLKACRNPTFNAVLRALYSAYSLKLAVSVCCVGFRATVALLEMKPPTNVLQLLPFVTA